MSRLSWVFFLPTIVLASNAWNYNEGAVKIGILVLLLMTKGRCV